MNKNPSIKALLEIIEQALSKRGISARHASILATGGPELIRSIRRGSTPSVEKVRALCEVLKLEFYIGPIRSETLNLADSPERKRTIDGMFQEIISRLPPKSSPPKTAEPKASYVSESDLVRYIPILEIEGTARKKSDREDYQKPGYVAFHSGWFSKNRLNFEHCVIMEISDESMEPTITEGSIVLIDRSRYRRRVGSIYAVQTNDNIVVRRLAKDENGWQLASDHPEWKSEPLPNSAKIIGEVKWTAKTFG